MQKEELRSIATLVGTTVGAGILAVPYLFAKVGYLTGLLCMVLVFIISAIIHLYYGEIALRTKGKHELPGYAQIYLGKKFKHFITFFSVGRIYISLTVYFILISNILFVLFGISNIFWIVLFAIFAAMMIYLGLKVVGLYESLFAFIPLALIALIFSLLFSKIDFQSLNSFNIKSFFIPIGVLLFSSMGITAVPQINEELKNKKNFKKIILISLGTVFLCYLLFLTAISGTISLSDFEKLNPNERVATIAVGSKIGGAFFSLINLFAIFSISNAFLCLGTSLKEIFQYDYRLKSLTSFALVLFIPLLMVLLNLTDFITYISIGGAIGGMVEVLAIMLILRKAKKHSQRHPEYSIKETNLDVLFIISLFMLGFISQFL